MTLEEVILSKNSVPGTDITDKLGQALGTNLVTRAQMTSVNDHHDDAICNITAYAGDTALYLKWDQTSNLWEQ